MASIRKRGSTWQVRVNRKGFPGESASFGTKAEAQEWARVTEAAMDRGAFRSPRPMQDMLFGELLARYREEVSPLKRGGADEAIRLRAMERSRIAQLSLANVSPQAIASFRDARLGTCKADTVIRDLAVLSSIFSHARREWQLPIDNPVAQVRKPQASLGRSRVLSSEEETRLLSHAEATGRRNPLIQPLLILATETAMRRGELLALRWSHVDLDRRVAYLPLTKNGRDRWVPLSSRAVAALRALEKTEGHVFPWAPAAIHKAFKRLCARAGMNDLRFHDLRHTATTRLAVKLPNVIELAAVTGHQSLQMLKRYYHPTAEALATKIG